jgi:hypothetical protein
MSEEEWVQLDEDQKQESMDKVTIEMSEFPKIVVDTPIPDNTQPSNDVFQTEDKELQITYFSNFLVEHVSVETSRKISKSIVSSLRLNTHHPDLLLDLMLIMKYLRVSGHVKKSLVKKIYLEVYDELDWLQRDCDRLIDQLVLKLPRSFQQSRSCASIIPECLMCFICS